MWREEDTGKPAMIAGALFKNHVVRKLRVIKKKQLIKTTQKNDVGLSAHLRRNKTTPLDAKKNHRRMFLKIPK